MPPIFETIQSQDKAAAKLAELTQGMRFSSTTHSRRSGRYSLRAIAVYLCFVCHILFAWQLGAVIYFVDFDNGSDANTGTATNTAWRHCPGDTNATSVPAKKTLLPGDSVHFKGGVAYYGGVVPTWSGTESNRIIFQSSVEWGFGRAVLDGTSDGSTNLYGFDVRGKYNTVSGFEFRNFAHIGVRTYYGYPNGIVISNNLLHHIGYFPYNRDVYRGSGVSLNNLRDALVISNEIYDCNYKAIEGNPANTNVIIWGNHLHDVMNDGIALWAYGFTLIAFNHIHNLTNGYTHADGMQILGFPANSPLVICGNIVHDCTQNIYIDPYSKPVNNFLAGKCYVFNNIVYNSDPGTNGMLGWYNGGGIDTYNSIDTVWYFNNTFVDLNCGTASGVYLYKRDSAVVVSNYFVFNNLFYNSNGGLRPTNVVNYASGHNLWTNFWRGKYLPGHGNDLTTLENYRNIYGAQYENNSLTAPVLFSGYANRDFRLQPDSGGIQQGTNLSNLLPDFSFIPSPWRPDPSKDALGVSRQEIWDIGALAFTGSTLPARPSRPPNLRLVP